MKFNFITGLVIILYLICAGISGANFENSDISTVLIPIAFYTLVNIILRNCKQNRDTTRLNDFNDMCLFGYAIAFISIKLWIYDIITDHLCIKGWMDKAVIVGGSIVIIVCIIVILLIFILPCISKCLNKESHYHE